MTVVHPLNHELVQGASTSADLCLEAAEQRKHCEKDAKFNDLGWQCIPFIVSAYGSWGKEATAAFQRIAWKIAVQEHQSETVTKRDLYARLYMVLSRCTARAILAPMAPETIADCD